MLSFSCFCVPMNSAMEMGLGRVRVNCSSLPSTRLAVLQARVRLRYNPARITGDKSGGKSVKHA